MTHEDPMRPILPNRDVVFDTRAQAAEVRLVGTYLGFGLRPMVGLQRDGIGVQEWREGERAAFGS